MTLPSFRAAGALAHDIVGVTPGAPAGLTAGDVELLVCESQDEAISLATANGFVEVTGSPISVPNATATIATRGALFWRRWNGTDVDPVTNDPGNHILAQRFAFSGCAASGDPWDFVDTSSEAVEDTSGSADSSSSTAGADRLIAIVVGAAKPDTVSTAELSNWANANLANLTERADNAGNSGNGGHAGLATGEKASAGSVGATTYDKATTAYKWHFVVALKPEEAAADPAFLPELVEAVADFDDTPHQWAAWPLAADVFPEDFLAAPELEEAVVVFDDTLFNWMAGPNSLSGLPGFTIGLVRVTSTMKGAVVTLAVKAAKVTTKRKGVIGN